MIAELFGVAGCRPCTVSDVQGLCYSEVAAKPKRKRHSNREPHYLGNLGSRLGATSAGHVSWATNAHKQACRAFAGFMGTTTL